ncbi:MAG: PstS family phosphate ABC transporter substrate-binding protein, partial [Planctomycetota bacterium]
ETYREERPEVRVTVGLSGTGGGMKKFAAGEIDICNASRRIKPIESRALDEGDVGFVELSVALDGIAIVVHPMNDWVDHLSVEQLASMWRPDAPANKWNDIDPAWPNEPITLYGPGTNSGTFDYFTEAIVGEQEACRSDYVASEDDNVLVTGVSQDKYALGYFGFAYYVENRDKLKLLSIRNDAGEYVTPTAETIRTNDYAPLSRPLYLYVRESLLERPDGADFVRYFLDNSARLSQQVGYVPVSDQMAADNDARYANAIASRE